MIDFVNTRDPDTATDAIATPQGLAAWLAQRQLAPSAAARVSPSDHKRAISLREALRRLMLANNVGTDDAEATDELERAARHGDLGVHFERGEAVALRPGAEGVAGALARLLVPVAQAMADDSWRRVKACRAADCEWAFYDRSRNRSGVWCTMAVCGNRTKVRAYRARPAVGRRAAKA